MRTRGSAKQTQFGPARILEPGATAPNKPNFEQSAGPDPGRSCQTKPIRPRRCRARTPNPRRAELCETNPIWLSRLASRSESCKTNPIRGDRVTPPFHHSIVPAFQLKAARAKQTQSPSPPRQSCETNPISSEPGRRDRPIAPNKPNFSRPGGREASVQNKANSSIADRGLPERHQATGIRLRRSCRIADWIQRDCRGAGAGWGGMANSQTRNQREPRQRL